MSNNLTKTNIVTISFKDGTVDDVSNLDLDTLIAEIMKEIADGITLEADGVVIDKKSDFIDAVITINDTFELSPFKTIPLIWKLTLFRESAEGDVAEDYIVNVTAEGVIVNATFTCDHNTIRADLYDAKGYINRLYKRELKIKKLYPIVKEAADKACKALGIDSPAIRFYTDERDGEWGYCDPETKTINIDYKLADAPRKYLNGLVSHECCHLKILGHKKDFWDLYHKVIEDSNVEVNDGYYGKWEIEHGHKYYDYPFADGAIANHSNKYNLTFDKKFDYVFNN